MGSNLRERKSGETTPPARTRQPLAQLSNNTTAAEPIDLGDAFSGVVSHVEESAASIASGFWKLLSPSSGSYSCATPAYKTFTGAAEGAAASCASPGWNCPDEEEEQSENQAPSEAGPSASPPAVLNRLVTAVEQWSQQWDGWESDGDGDDGAGETVTDAVPDDDAQAELAQEVKRRGQCIDALQSKVVELKEALRESHNENERMKQEHAARVEEFKRVAEERESEEAQFHSQMMKLMQEKAELSQRVARLQRERDSATKRLHRHDVSEASGKIQSAQHVAKHYQSINGSPLSAAGSPDSTTTDAVSPDRRCLHEEPKHIAHESSEQDSAHEMQHCDTDENGTDTESMLACDNTLEHCIHEAELEALA